MKNPRFSKHLLAAILFSSVTALSLVHAADGPATSGTYTGTPYNKTPAEIPGTIQAEYYDVAPGNAKGISYQRKGDPKPGKARTTGDNIGMGTIGDDHVSTTGERQHNGDIYVGWTDVGDWWSYTVNVKEAGTYNFGGKVAAGAKGAKISVTFTPVSGKGEMIKTGPIEIPTTAGFQPGVEVYHVWETLDKLAQVKLPAGNYIMTVKVEAVAGLNIDYYTLTKQ